MATFIDILPAHVSPKVEQYIDALAEFRVANGHRKLNKLGRARQEQAGNGKVPAVAVYGRKAFADYISHMICSEWSPEDGEGLRQLALDLLDANPKKEMIRQSGTTNKVHWLRYYDYHVTRQIAYAIYDKRHRFFAINDPTAQAFDPSHIEYYGAF